MILALLACGPKVAVEGATEGAVEAPQRTGRARASAAEVQPLPGPVIPAFSGPPPGPEIQFASRLELTNLTWTHINFTIEADTAALNTIDDVDALQRHLAADPRWKLHRREGLLTAEQRMSVDEHWRLQPYGFNEEDERVWRVAVRFEPYGEGALDLELWSVTQAGAPAIKVEGMPLLDKRMSTSIIVEAEHLAVEIFESGPDSDRRITAEALGTLPVVLPEVLPDRVAQRGYDPAWLSEQHIHSGEPTASLSLLPSGNTEITAWLNPGGPGWTWTRLLADDQPFHDDLIPVWSTERIGWGGDELFYYQAIVPTLEDGTPTTAQIWHLPDDSETPVKLLEWAL